LGWLRLRQTGAGETAIDTETGGYQEMVDNIIDGVVSVPYRQLALPLGPLLWQSPAGKSEIVITHRRTRGPYGPRVYANRLEFERDLGLAFAHLRRNRVIPTLEALALLMPIPISAKTLRRRLVDYGLVSAGSPSAPALAQFSRAVRDPLRLTA